MSIGTPIPTAQAQLDPDDPWPCFGHDERNSCRGSNRGPHSPPQLRWWAPIGTHWGGAAIVAKINGERLIFVTAYDGGAYTPVNSRIEVFRFHPDPYLQPDYDPFTEPATPILTIHLDDTSNQFTQGTPLVFQHQGQSVLVVQTRTALRAFDVSGLPTTFDPLTDTLWTYSLPAPLAGGAGGMPWAPTFGLSDPTAATSGNIYCIHDAVVYCITPAGSLSWSCDLQRPGNNDYCSVALGPIQGTTTRAFVYATTWAPLDVCDLTQWFRPDFHALYADGNLGSPLAWQATINDYIDWRTWFEEACNGGDIPNIAKGSLGSPSVWGPGSARAGQVLVGSDDWGFYAFDNVTSTPPEPQRWVTEANSYISCTPGLASDDTFIFWSESHRVYRMLDQGTSVESQWGEYDLDTQGANGSAPALDSASRMYMATRSNGPGYLDHEAVILGFAYGTPNPDSLLWRWTFEPPTIVIGQDTHLLRRGFLAPPAIDEDGTVIATNSTYIIAVRPLLGDLNGDGVLSCQDANALVAALLGAQAWESQYGSPLGINLLGVADGDNNGVFNANDLDDVMDVICAADPTCQGCSQMLAEGDGCLTEEERIELIIALYQEDWE